MEFDLNDIELTDEQKQAITAKLNEQTSGLRAKTQELLGKLNASKTELNEFKSQFDGLDIGAVKSIVAKASMDEESRLIAEGKLDEVVNRRTELLRADYEKKLQAAQAEAEQAQQFKKRFGDKVLRDAISSAALKAGVLPEAVDDIFYRARDTFTLNEDGEAVALDRDGEVIFGPDAKTPLSPVEWAESLREKAPYFWPRAQGAGMTGDKGGKASRKWNEYSEMERAALARENPDKFKQLLATRGN